MPPEEQSYLERNPRATEEISDLISALDHQEFSVRELAARHLASQGASALEELLRSIAFNQHKDYFFAAAHHALYFLQFYAPLRDRAILSTLLVELVGPNAASVASGLALEIVQA